MKKIDFVDKLSEFCEFESQDLKIDTELKSIDGYDSLAIMSLIAFVDENFSMKLNFKQIQDLTDFNSIILLIGEDKFEND